MSDAVEQLRDRVEELEELLGLHSNLSNVLGLTPTQVKLVGLLVRRPIANRELIFSAVYGGLSDTGPSVIDVHIHNIRRKLAPKGMTIKSRYGEGFYLDDYTRNTLKEMCAS